MKRKIIKINEDLCCGCGNCIAGCKEGALKLVNGKAKLIKEDFCDGFGDCIGACPTDALTIEEREAKPFDKKSVQENLSTPCSCPGSSPVSLKKDCNKTIQNNNSYIEQAIPSELNHWPVQLRLVNPLSPDFLERELVVLSTCSPVASADIHWRYLRNRALVLACPKLDRTDGYVEKLAEIFKQAKTPKVIAVIMEVACCYGLSRIVKEAIKLSKRNDIIFEQDKISLEGKLIEIK